MHLQQLLLGCSLTSDLLGGVPAGKPHLSSGKDLALLKRGEQCLKLAQRMGPWQPPPCRSASAAGRPR